MSFPVRRYAIVHVADNLIENVILWDGARPYAPPEGYEIMLEVDALSLGLVWRPRDE